MTRQEALKRARAVYAATAPPLEGRFWSKVDRRGPTECWPWRAGVRRKSEGYGAFYFKGRHHPAGRIAWFLTKGEMPEAGVVVCHECDNPPCCNPAHLFLGTNQQNTADKVAKGRQAKGSRNGFSKLNEAQVREIKSLRPAAYCPKGFRRDLAARFGVSPATITDVWSRRWKHIS